MAPTQEQVAASNLFIAASDGEFELVQYFLANGNKVTDQDELGYSVFHAAASYNHIDLMKYLLTLLGSETMPVDADGDTPLHVAETVEMAQLLVSHSPALPMIANSDGVLAIENADEEGYQSLVAYLKENFNTNYVSLALREQAGLQAGLEQISQLSEEDLMHVLSAADLHEGGENGEGELRINVGKLQELIASGQLDNILAHQRNVESQNQENEGAAEQPPR
ncbi:UNVERIFIED_CONTAM: hypothetical protein HDU68_005776 [Siphonaria sp. JEL0065]|nr:hypothetical protein HDU68_005776 [Siphonaria sp. JEL0065]